jgi:hypothetical protein
MLDTMFAQAVEIGVSRDNDDLKGLLSTMVFAACC